MDTSHDKESLNDLLFMAEEWMKDYGGQQYLFADDSLITSKK